MLIWHSFSGIQDCRNERNCHRDASCEFDEEEGRFMCLCHPGYVGNGIGTLVYEISREGP